MMKNGFVSCGLLSTCRKGVSLAFALLALAVVLPSGASASTVRTKSDRRLWETVTDRSAELSWGWERTADAARLSFFNRLTGVVSSCHVPRTNGAMRGSCAHPVPPATDEALVVATLVQTAGDVEIACATAELAYAPGAAGRSLTVRTKSGRDWWRVRSPQLTAFDARWWNVAGNSGHEVMWATPPGWHRVERAFEGEGVVDECVLKFGTLGFLLLIR